MRPVKRGARQPEGPYDREAAMLALRARRAAARGLEAAAFPLLVAPANDWPLRPLPAARRRLYEEHLRGLLAPTPAAVAEWVPPALPLPAALDRVLQEGCTACRGYCCHTGGAHAYQTVDTVRRVRRARPRLGDEGLVALYLSHLPARSVRGSCVFHGRRGCTLPRQLRGDMCNNWFCRPLLAWRDRALASGDASAFVLAFDDGLLRGGRFFGPALPTEPRLRARRRAGRAPRRRRR